MKTLNINDYLHQVDQNFSGMNGNADWPTGGQNAYNDLYFSGADGVTATRQAAPRKSPNPFRITIVNSTGGTLTAKLFGNNIYNATANYGSAAGLVVTTGMSNTTYFQLLLQSATQPFETSLIRVESSNTSQVTQVLNITSRNAAGFACSYPLAPEDYFSVAQLIQTRVDIEYSQIIDGNTFIDVDILAGATVKYTFFPLEQVNTTRALRGVSETPLTSFAAPAVKILANTRPASYPAQIG